MISKSSLILINVGWKINIFKIGAGKASWQGVGGRN